jgi:hypothetical protein
MKRPELSIDQDLAVWVIGEMGTGLFDAQGNPNVALIKTMFDLNEVPPEIQPQVLKDIITICDELRKPKDGKQDPTYH